MWDFIIKYWMEFAFGLVIAIFSFFFKRTMTLYKKEQKNEKDEFLGMIKKEISNEFEKSLSNEKKLQGQIDTLTTNIGAVTKGLLSVQRRTFEADCIKLLDENHVITLDEYEQISKDHDAYNGLGGNHNGDRIFDLVKKKVENQLTTIIE